MCVFCERIRDGAYLDRVQNVVSFEPLGPVVPGHMLFVPVNHLSNAAAHPALTGVTFEVAARYGKQCGEEFNLITSSGPNATQSIYHLHVHYVPRRLGDGLHLPWTGQRRDAG